MLSERLWSHPIANRSSEGRVCPRFGGLGLECEMQGNNQPGESSSQAAFTFIPPVFARKTRDVEK